MRDDEAGSLRRLSHVARVLLVMLVFAALALSIINLPPVATGLSGKIHAELAGTGIGSPVTATLLDFRAYDTFLEIAVLLLAVTAIRALSRGDPSARRPDDEILASFSRILVPFMILIAGYLLMAGIDASGGAFQAGAILAAAGILLVLAGRLALPGQDLPIRLGLAIGLAAFVVVGIACMVIGGAFLDLPQRGTAYVVLILEIAVSVSVALSLLEMFVGVLRRGASGSTTRGAKQAGP